jgi:exodeoxyribonuclease VII large subunit
MYEVTDSTAAAKAEAIEGSPFPGPFPVGAYAVKLKQRLLEMARVQLVGEAFNVRPGRVRVYFELRDARGALPCSMWRDDFDALGIELSDGLRVVVAGGCDYYPGSASASPSFSFAVTDLRIAGEGDLLAELARLRRQLHAEGLFEPQKRLPRAQLPRTIGVVTGEQGKARDDVLAGLRRRGWAGRVVWGFAPVQDRRAAPMIALILRELAAIQEIDVVIVARGGGSIADLAAFCDETLCRTVALLRVPVISSVGHHTDRTLLDDIAAVSCSTPTHAAEAAVPIDLNGARSALVAHARRLDANGRRAVLHRARILGELARAPAEHVARDRRRLHQLLREVRAGARRHGRSRRQLTDGQTASIQRAGHRATTTEATRRRNDLQRLSLALAAHDPARTLERGYALVSDRAGEPLTSAAAAVETRELRITFHDGEIDATATATDAAAAAEQEEER